MPRLPEGERRIPEGMNRVCTKSVESEVHPCTLEFAEWIVFIKGRCSLLLRELLSLGVEYQGQMHVAGSLGTERLDELDLTRRVVEQVGAAHHVGDALMYVVDDGGELIGQRPSARLSTKSPTSCSTSCVKSPQRRSVKVVVPEVVRKRMARTGRPCVPKRHVPG